MGIFSRNDDNRKYETAAPQPELSEAERNEILRANAIEYIVSLPKADKDKFFAAADLIWAGYDKLDRVKTRDEKAQAIVAAPAAPDEPTTVDEDDDVFNLDFLTDDEPTATNPLVQPTVSAAVVPSPKTGTSVDVVTQS